MKKLYERVQPYKFRMTVFALLCGATLLSLILFRVRTLLTGSLDYAFLVWKFSSPGFRLGWRTPPRSSPGIAGFCYSLCRWFQSSGCFSFPMRPTS